MSKFNKRTKLNKLLNDRLIKPIDLDERTYNVLRRLIYSDHYFNGTTNIADLLKEIDTGKLLKQKQIGIKTILYIKNWINNNIE